MDGGMTHKWERDTPGSKEASLDLTKTHDSASIFDCKRRPPKVSGPRVAAVQKTIHTPRVFTRISWRWEHGPVGGFRRDYVTNIAGAYKVGLVNV